MDLQDIARALPCNAAAALAALRQYNDPLTEKEYTQLCAFRQEQLEQLEAGLRVEEGTPELTALAARPVKALHPLAVVQCVLAAARLPYVDRHVQRVLQRHILPLVAAQTPLEVSEWGSVLAAALQLPLSHSRTSLQCAEQVLRVCGAALVAESESGGTGQAGLTTLRALFKLPRSVHLVARRAENVARVRTHTLSEVRVLYLQLVAEVVWHGATRVRNYVQLCLCGPSADAPPAWVCDAFATLTPSETVAVSLLLRHPALAVSKEQLATLLKSRPGALHAVLGGLSNVPHEALHVRGSSEELIRWCLYSMGLTTITRDTFLDHCALLLALAPRSELQAYLLTHGAEAVTAWLVPFVHHAKVLTWDVACEVGPAYGRLLAGLCTSPDTAVTLLRAVATAVVHVLANRCRAATEKASVLRLLGDLCAVPALSTGWAQLLDDNDDVGAALVAAVEREVAIPVAESARPALRVVRLLRLESRVEDGLTAAIHSARKDQTMRRALLVQLDPTRTPAPLVDELVGDVLQTCTEVEVVRGDAFLALYLVCHRDPCGVARLAAFLSRAEVLAGLVGGDEDEMQRTADVARALSRLGHHAAVAMLLTSREGRLRRCVRDHLRTIADDAVAVVSLWDSMTQVVFGLNASTAPAILSDSAAPALRDVATLLLSRHTARLTLAPTLTELLLCCGHDAVQGVDASFYQPGTSRGVWGGVLRDVLALSHTDLTTSVHAAAVMDGVVTAMAGPEHVAMAACRATALLLRHTTGTTAQHVFLKLREAVVGATRYFYALDPRDRAIAAGDAETMARYETATLRARQLLKVFAERPPKGVSTEDYHDLQRAAAVALEKGRAELRTEVGRRASELAPVVARHKLPFLALRLVGLSGGFDLCGVALLYPHLQDILNHAEDVVDDKEEEKVEEVAPSVLTTLALDAVVALLRHTPLGPMVARMACTVARLRRRRGLSAQDVAGIAVTAHALRQAVTAMLPAPLFVVLVAFAQVAFTPGRGGAHGTSTIATATQHQLLGLLLQNLGQPDLPNAPETMELLGSIVQSFPALFKSVQQGFLQLMPLIPLSRLDVVEAGLFHAVDTVREVTAVALVRFGHFAQSRRALLLAAVFARDASSVVARGAQQVLSDPRHVWHLQPTDWPDLIYLLSRYGGTQRANAVRLVPTLQPLFAAADAAQQMSWVHDLTHVGGLASVVVLAALSSSFRAGVAVGVMEFLCTTLEGAATSETVMREVLGAGRVVLTETALDTLRAMAPELQSRLSRPPREATAAKKEQYLATATVWLTIISCRLQETQLLESIMEQQSRILNNSQSAMVHRGVCESMIEITRNAAVRTSPKLDEFVEKCLKQIFHSGSYIKKKAHAWGLAGVLKGLGLPALRRYGVAERILSSARERQSERSGAMVLLEVLCETMGAGFEPYALALSQVLLEGVADPDPKISDCADDASRVMMRHLSAIGLRQLVPHLIDMLAAEQAKRRVAPLNFVGYVAFCAPRQLAAALPQIMKHINACLFDVNTAVAVAAFTALRRVAGVVSCPEIQEHVELILNAMRSPSTETENALDALLYTRFVNVVDPASLALIIPVLSRGLSGQVPRARPKAAQIVAAMVSLVAESRTLAPYTDELVTLLEAASQDPQSEARTTAARALGALAAAMGNGLVDEIASWCFTVLQRVHAGSIEKAGAAQVLVELVHACGAELLQVYFGTIEAGMRDERPPVREGFLHIMVYAPSTLQPETFQGFLPVSFPWVLEGLSHFSDKVRDVALAAGDGIISLYGTRNLRLMLDPLLRGVQSEVTTMRQSSLLLSAKLLLHLVALIRRRIRVKSAQDEAAADSVVDEEDGATDTAGPLTMETARSVEKRGGSVLGGLEEMLGGEALVRLLSAIYCGRHEHNAGVRGDCNLAWQACVASIRVAVNKMFTSLVHLLLHLCASDNADCVEVAAKTIEYTTSMNEMVERFVDAFCEHYTSGDDRTRLGALVGLSTVVQFADARRLMSMGGQIVGCVLPAMQDVQGGVRDAAREVFARVTKTVGSRLIEGAVEAQLTTSVRGVVEVVKVRPGVALAIVFRHLDAQTTFTEANRELVDAILEVEAAAEHLRAYADPLARILLAMLVQGDLDEAGATMQKYVEFLPRDREATPLEYVQKALHVPATRRGALLAAEAYGLGTSLDNTDGLVIVWRAVVTTLGDGDAVTRAHAVRIVPRLLTSLEHRLVRTLTEDETRDVTSSKRAASRYLLQFLDPIHDALAVTMRAHVTRAEPEFGPLAEGEPRVFDVLMGYYNRGLDYGGAEQKVTAVQCIQDLLEFAPRPISAAAANTVAGRCSKVLFTRNEGVVVHALVQLCLRLLHYPASGKEKMVEGTMALAMFNAALCDSGPARALALRVVVELLRRSAKYADLILGTVWSKKASVEGPVLRTVLCRFVSTVVRYAEFERASPHVTRLFELVREMWEAAESPAQAAAAGVAVGALCKSVSVADDAVGDVKERTLAISSTRGVHAIAGYALVFGLIRGAPTRIDQTFLEVAADNVASAAEAGASDKLSSLWVLRAAAAVAGTGSVSVRQFRPEAYVAVLRRVSATDEQMMSTAQYFCDTVRAAYPDVAGTLFGNVAREPSAQWVALGHFDADFDDELVADTVY